MFRMAVFKGIKRYDVLAKTSVIANPFNITGVLLCAYFEASLSNFVLVYCSACLVYGVSARIFTNELPNSQWSDSIIDDHKKRILFQMLSATGIVFLGSLIFKQSQVIVLEQSEFFSDAGFFNIGFLLSTAAITLIPGIYQEILLPKITDAVQDGDVKSQVQQAERYLIMLSLLVAIPVVIYAEVIIDILYGARYHDAVFSLQVMIILKAIMTLNQGANLTLISHDKQIGMVKINVVMFAIAVFLSLIFVPYLGLNGALMVYGVLVIVLLISYSLLAKNCGYKMISLSNISRIVIPALLSALPVLIVNQFTSGVLAAIIGSSIFTIIYLNLLFMFKGYDKSVVYILKQLLPKMPNVTKGYLSWAIDKLK
jgi:O-antigen/teichoic acid export membrane protein